MKRPDAIASIVRRRRLDEIAVCDEANILAVTGIRCDNAILTRTRFYTDFRYAAMVRRAAPELRVGDIRRFAVKRPPGRRGALRVGYESSISKSLYDRLVKCAPRGTRFVDVSKDLELVRAVKTADEIERLRAAESLNCEIWREASARFRAGMTEREMARIVQTLMAERGDGEAFSTIVCVGANAAECHHEPDGTVWNGRDGVLVDMGVKLGGVCSDLTRNLPPKRQSATYRRVFGLVREAHDAAIAAARPGMTAAALDRVARRIIAKGGFGKCFGHSLGHGVGYEIHESPSVSKRSKDVVLEPGMVITVEPGVYLEGNLGVRIEDMVLITETGCELLSTNQ